MQEYNYHTHTYRCGHGVGREEEYVKSAIESQFKVLGFSEHLPFEDWIDPHERPTMAEKVEYEKIVRELGSKYPEIKIKLGYETEYFKDMDSYIKETSERVDYLILGQHSLERTDLYLHDSATDYEVRKMAEIVCKGLRTGYFKYLAHPDYFMRARETYSKECDKAIREIAIAAKENCVYVELNLKGFLISKGIVDGEETNYYPYKKVFKTMSEIGPKFAIGYDAHSPKFLNNREAEEQLRKAYSYLKIEEREFI